MAETDLDRQPLKIHMKGFDLDDVLFVPTKE